MSDNSRIEWTDATWNPVRAMSHRPLPGAEPGDLGDMKLGWHCEHVSPGCANCYAEPMNRRLGTGLPYKPGHRADVTVFVDEKALQAPLRWRRPRMIFVGSMTDLFADFVTDAMLDRIFAVMALCPHHTFQLLTKRPERMRAYLWTDRRAERCAAVDAMFPDRTDQSRAARDRLARQTAPGVPAPLENVWLGASVEDQRRADERIPVLLNTPAAIRWISAEPLLGPVDLRNIAMPQDEGRLCSALDGHEIAGAVGQCVGWIPPLDWVVVGGESGPGARAMHPDWARSLRDQCAAAGVPFLFKQWGAWRAELDRDKDDPDWRAPYSGKYDDGREDIAWLNLAGGRGFHGERFHIMKRVGKKAAGRLLDDVTHDAFPERAHV